MKKEVKTARLRRKTHTVHRCMQWIDRHWVDMRYGKTLAVIAPNLPKYVLDFALQPSCKEMVWSDEFADYIIHPGRRANGMCMFFEIDVTTYGADDQYRTAYHRYCKVDV